jgi:hypothetical protein
MSFFKKVKDRFTAPKANVTLQLNKSSYGLGENVEGTLAAASNEEFDCKEVRIEFQCVERKKRMVSQYDAVIKTQVMKEVEDTATLWQARPVLTGPMHISTGFQQSYPVSINIPAGARPSYHSIEDNITWSLKGVIAIDGRPDVTSRTIEIQVLPMSAAPTVKEIIREVVMVPCKYCRALMPETDTVCPNCGARRTD